MSADAVDHARILKAIESRVSYRQFLMTVGALFVMMGGAYLYHTGQKWHEAGGEMIVRAATDQEHNREAIMYLGQDVEELRAGQRRIESKVDVVIGELRGDHRGN